MIASLPEKLEPDAILESILEVRFQPSSEIIPEVLYGRLADAALWKNFSQKRLPTADIPQQLRSSDANLRYQPSIELSSSDGRSLVRIGPYMLGYLRVAPYPGWKSFREEIKSAINALYESLPQVKIERIGLRYVNALTSDRHGVRNIHDIGVDVSIESEPLLESFNLNIKKQNNDDFEILTRIATVDLVVGSPPPNTSLIVDVDVFTKAAFSSVDQVEVMDRIDEAHRQEKKMFFSVLGTKATERLSRQ